MFYFPINTPTQFPSKLNPSSTQLFYRLNINFVYCFELIKNKINDHQPFLWCGSWFASKDHFLFHDFLLTLVLWKWNSKVEQDSRFLLNDWMSWRRNEKKKCILRQRSLSHRILTLSNFSCSFCALNAAHWFVIMSM